jgi:hypothetical protein
MQSATPLLQELVDAVVRTPRMEIDTEEKRSRAVGPLCALLKTKSQYASTYQLFIGKKCWRRVCFPGAAEKTEQKLTHHW